MQDSFYLFMNYVLTHMVPAWCSGKYFEIHLDFFYFPRRLTAQFLWTVGTISEEVALFDDHGQDVFLKLVTGNTI